MTEFHANATLSYRKDLGEELMIIRVAPDTCLNTLFEPGQYAELAVCEKIDPSSPHQHSPKIERKQYSIASSAKDTDCYEFSINLIETGKLTPRLWRLNEGDRLWMNSKIKGKFTLKAVPPMQHILAIASGTGIAPFIAMLRTFADNPPWQSFTLMHTARQSCELGYHQELNSMMAKYRSIYYLPRLTRESSHSAWSGKRGRIVPEQLPSDYTSLTGVELNPAHCQILLCGNPEMIADMLTFFESRSFKIHSKKEPGQIHFERYW